MTTHFSKQVTDIFMIILQSISIKQVYKHHHYLNRQQEGGGPSNATNFDGKRMRKNVSRKTVDYNSSVVRLLEVCLTGVAKL